MNTKWHARYRVCLWKALGKVEPDVEMVLEVASTQRPLAYAVVQEVMLIHNLTRVEKAFLVIVSGDGKGQKKYFEEVRR